MADKALVKQIDLGFSNVGKSLVTFEKMVSKSFGSVGKIIKSFNTDVLKQTSDMMKELGAQTKLMTDQLAALNNMSSKSGKSGKKDPALAAIVAQVKLLQHRNMLERDY